MEVQSQMKTVVNSIVKARDDKTQIKYEESCDTYLSTLMLAYIERIEESNLYNFKFTARTINPEEYKEIYLNMLIIINDPSIVSNSKYFIKDKYRKEFIESYALKEKENKYNSYRIDMSINLNEGNNYLTMEIVNIFKNTSSLININREIFFKISIFLHQLFNYNIIDGAVISSHYSIFRVPGDEKSLQSIRESGVKLYTLYWIHTYIVLFIDPTNQKKIIYMVFQKEEFEKIMEKEKLNANIAN